ncbi:MAG: hypothetical protein A2284_14590 [Deltaproteobacteria bacterium RIFOXYA12_FULL_61_11]|nr:MAG: hypothetical protein A2284_14590 [Deltaproteobacteria bacterium RIFOXYA12_FULL_61_11]
MTTGSIPPEVPPEVRRWLGEQLFLQVPSNIVVVDRQYRVVLANHQFTEVFGEAIGRRCYQVYKRREEPCQDCLAAKTFLDGAVHVNDEVGRDLNGKAAHYVVYTSPVFDEAGEISHVIEMSHDVTETKNLQRAYNLLFERAPCYISVINRDLRVVRANEQVREKFGERIGEHCYEVYKHRGERCPDCPTLGTFADGKIHCAEQIGTDKHGKRTHFIVSTAPLAHGEEPCNHVIELSTDVTAVRQLNDQLREEASFQRILIESTLDALVAMDREGKVRVFNPAAEELFGISADEVIGKVAGDRFMPARFLQVVEHGEDNLSLEEAVVEDGHGEKLPVRFCGSVLRDGPHILGGAAFFQDLRERKRLEKENLDNERLAAVGQTVAQLAHGIKNILNGLQGGMYILRSGMRSNSQERTTRGWSMLERNVEHITTLVKGFLTFAKGRTPKVSLLDTNAVGREVYELYHATAAAKGITLHWTPAPGVQLAAMDAEGLHTCLANLVSNALDACQTSPPDRRKVTLSSSETEGTLIFAVTDTGCGMEYEIKNKVFTTFFTTKGTEGTGLGLLVTRKITQEHGGHIEVHSEPGSGSTFKLLFPRHRLPRPSETEPHPSSSGGDVHGET